MSILRTKKKLTRIDTDSETSNKQGIGGWFEGAMRRFKVAVHAVSLLPIYLVAAFCLGLAATPGIFLVEHVSAFISHWAPYWRYPALGVSFALAFFLYGFSLILVVPAVNWVVGSGVRAWRGPYYSLPAIKWYVHNGLTYLVRYTFLEFITPTPFNLLFYRLMGMKIGRGTLINSSHISDPSLIQLGEKVTIGGSATILGHYGMAGFLVIAPVVIGDGATIGLKATIMGGAEIGSRAKIMPNSVVLPRTKVPAGETWGGVPARKIDIRKAA